MRVTVKEFEDRSGLKSFRNPNPDAPIGRGPWVIIERPPTALVGRNNPADHFLDPNSGHSVSRAEAWQRFNANHGPSEKAPEPNFDSPVVTQAPARSPLRFTPLERLLARFF